MSKPVDGHLVRIEVVRSIADLRAHAPTYEALLERLPHDTRLFYSLPWLEISSSVYVTPQRCLYFLLAWQDARLIGVAPLQLEQKSLTRGSVRSLMCWGDVDGTLMLQGGFLIPDEEDIDRCIAAFARHALDPRAGAADYFVFRYLGENSRYFAAVQRYFRPQTNEVEDMPSYQVMLPATFEAYAQTVSTSTLANASNRWRALQKVGGIEFVFVQQLSPEELDQVMQLHAARQGALRERGLRRQSLFEEPRSRAVYLRLLEQAAVDGSARHYLIKADGRVIAFGLGYRVRATLFFHLTSFDPDWSRFQPGRLIFFLMIQAEIEGGETRMIDTLPGITKVKQDFSNATTRYRRLSGVKPDSLHSLVKVGIWQVVAATAKRWRNWRLTCVWPYGDLDVLEAISMQLGALSMYGV